MNAWITWSRACIESSWSFEDYLALALGSVAYLKSQPFDNGPR
jgi:hypothetical protein